MMVNQISNYNYYFPSIIILYYFHKQEHSCICFYCNINKTTITQSHLDRFQLLQDGKIVLND